MPRQKIQLTISELIHRQDVLFERWKVQELYNASLKYKNEIRRAKVEALNERIKSLTGKAK